MARHPKTSNSGKLVPALGLTSSQNNVTDVQRDVCSLERTGAVKEATSNRCRAGEELIPARVLENEHKHDGPSLLPPSDFLRLYPWSNTTRGEKTRDARRINMERPALPPSHSSSTSPTPHTPKNRAGGQRRAEMGLEDKWITTSMVVLKYYLLPNFCNP